jgi:nicotinate-nucleotide adenylyltransferase
LKLGVLGGTFDPIHLGHLRTAEEIGQELNLEKVYLIPSASPPHKAQEPVTPFDHRLEMARLAVADSPLLDVLDLEGRRPGFSYSIETLKEIHSIFGSDLELFFIIGIDAFLEIKTWREYQNLFDYAHFVIIMRAGFQPDELDSFIVNLRVEVKKTDKPGVFIAPSGKSLILMAPTLIDISSTRIREMILEGKSILFLVAESVKDYIRKKGLYGEYANTR